MRTICLWTVFLLGLTGCGPTIRTLYDRKADISAYKSFCWMEGCDGKAGRFSGPESINDTLLLKNIRSAIVTDLESKGLRKDENNPELLVGFTITLNDERIVVYNQPKDDMPYIPIDNEGEEIYYLKGTLIIGIAEKSSGKVVWQSFAESYLDIEPDISEKRVLAGVKRILKNFPPKK